MNKFRDFDGQEYRNDILRNSRISYNDLYMDQQEAKKAYDKDEVSDLVSESFMHLDTAQNLLSSNGLFLKYAGPSIQNNFEMVRIACFQNGEAIKYASKQILTNPDLASTLILSVNFGHPCETYRKTVKDESLIMEVSKQIVLKDPNMKAWVIEHMYENNPPQEFYDFCYGSRRV